MAPACVILSLVLWTSISAPVVRRVHRARLALGVGVWLCFARSSERWFCEIVGDPWCFLGELWRVLISSPLISERFKDFVGFLCVAGPLVPVVPLAFVFRVFREVLMDAKVSKKLPPPILPISL